jgi:hypothetical protein
MRTVAITGLLWRGTGISKSNPLHRQVHCEAERSQSSSKQYHDGDRNPRPAVLYPLGVIGLSVSR